MKFALSVITAVLLASSSLVGAVPIDTQEIERQSAEGLSLLRLGPDVDPVWKTEEEKWELKKASVRFVDVTETWDYFQSNPTPQGAPKDLSVASACKLHHVCNRTNDGTHRITSSPFPIPPG